MNKHSFLYFHNAFAFYNASYNFALYANSCHLEKASAQVSIESAVSFMEMVLLCVASYLLILEAAFTRAGRADIIKGEPC